MNDFRKYFRRFSLFSVIVFVISLLLGQLLPEAYVSDVYFLYVPFFYLTGILSRHFLLHKDKRTDKRFPHHFVGITMARFFFYLAVLIAYSLVFFHDAIPFITGFFACYVVFTVYEIAMIHRILKKAR